jgi:hypothetical protein
MTVVEFIGALEAFYRECLESNKVERIWIISPLTYLEVPIESAIRPHPCRPKTPNHEISPLHLEIFPMRHSPSRSVVGLVVLPSGLRFLP